MFFIFVTALIILMISDTNNFFKIECFFSAPS